MRWLVLFCAVLSAVGAKSFGSRVLQLGRHEPVSIPFSFAARPSLLIPSSCCAARVRNVYYTLLIDRVFLPHNIERKLRARTQRYVVSVLYCCVSPPKQREQASIPTE